MPTHGFISIIGGDLFQPIADLLDKIRPRNPDAASSDVAAPSSEIGYAASICVLAAICVESFAMRVRSFHRDHAAAMDRNDRIRACYQHCALKWVMSEQMTNQSLRERFRLAEDKAAITSQIIAATITAGLIKSDESVGASRKFARYLPFWG